MDSKDYVYTRIHYKFNDIYKVEADKEINNDKLKPIEKFNSLDKYVIDNKVNEYIFTPRQIRPY